MGEQFWKAEDDAGLALALGFLDIGGRADRHDDVAMLLEHAMPAPDVVQGRAGVLPKHQRDVHGGDSAGTELLEQLAVPVAGLQGVDDDEIVVKGYGRS